MKHIENELEITCCNWARKFGIAAIKLEKNHNKGIPDRMFIKQKKDEQGNETGEIEVLFVEFKKSDKEKLKPEQVFWQNFLKSSHKVIFDFKTFRELDFLK